MSGYIGNIPVPQATQTRDVFTATSGQTTFATSGYSPGFLDVYQEGVHLTNGVDYTATNGSDVVLTVGATSGDVVEVVAYTSFSVADALTTGDIGVSVQGYSSVLANTTASFTTADETKLDGIEALADVTDTANVTAAGALMDSELTNITAVKAINQGVATTDSPTFAAATVNGNITVTGTVDGRDVAADGSKLDGIEAGADVTDATNVAAAGALMDSELTSEASVKALDQGVATTDSPNFAALNVNGTVTADGLTVEQSGTNVAVSFNNTNSDFTTTTSSALRLGVTYSVGTQYGEIRVAENSADTSLTNMLFYPKSNQLAMKLNNNGDISFYEDTGTTPKFFWDASAESLGIGNSIPSSFNSQARNLVIGDGVNRQGITIYTGATEQANIFFADGTTGSDPVRGGINYNHSNDSLSLRVNDSNRLTITSTGVALLGMTAADGPTGVTDINGTEIGRGYINLNRDDTSAVNQIQFGKNGSIAAALETGASDLRFKAGGNTERMRIDSSGNLLVGKTSSGISSAGHSYRSDGTWEVRRDIGTAGSSSVGYISRGTTDGNILTFYKDTTAVGSIGASGSRLYAGTSDTGLFFNANSESLEPYNPSTLLTRDAAIDLGSPDERFKDIYLSGSISDGTNSAGVSYVVNGSAKAWVNFNGTGTVAIRESLNVSSITDNGTGTYTVNLSNAVTDKDYSMVQSGTKESPMDTFLCGVIQDYAASSSSTCRIGGRDYDSTKDLFTASIAILR